MESTTPPRIKIGYLLPTLLASVFAVHSDAIAQHLDQNTSPDSLPDGAALRLHGEGVSSDDSLSTTARPARIPGSALALPTELNFRLQPGKSASAADGTGEAGGNGQGAGGGATELAKKLSNPIASLISVPFQFNYDEGYGPNDAGRYTLNIQPVIPFSISDDWNLITRTIVPLIHQDELADGLDSDGGIGDTVQSFFLSPKDTVHGWIIGAGPVVLWPTGTDPDLRSESLGLGPTLVALRQHKGLTYGALVNHIWSVTDSDDHEEVNSTFIQPFLAYNWPTATTLALNTESTYNWNAKEWNMPINLQLAQVVKIGGLPVQFQIGGRYYADSPDGGAEWGLRFTITFIFPR